MLRELVKRSTWATCGALVVRNYLDAARFSLGNIETGSGTAHQGLDPTASLGYIHEVFADYKRYAGVERFQGRVAEVGPGDNCGVGLLFLEDGCSQVDLVDRFFSRRNEEQQAAIYRALFAEHPGLAQRFGGTGPCEESAFTGIRRHYGSAAAGEVFFRSHRGYDLIVSRAVFEHLADPLVALRHMAAALNPGGLLLHKVDLRDHALFSDRSHELTFLEIPDWLYPHMVQSSGRPNRVLLHRYRDALRVSGLRFELLVTRLAGEGEVTPHLPWDAIPADRRARALQYVRGVRHRFAASFRQVADEDLAVAGVFLVARNPA